MTISQYNIVKTIALTLNASNGQYIYSILDDLPIRASNVISLNTFVKTLKAYAKISSLDAIKLPNFKLEDSETDKLYKTLDIEWSSPRKQLNLYIADDYRDWSLVGAVSLLNPSGYPYRIYNLFDLYTDGLAIELGENGRIGVQIQDVGYGSLSGNDSITIHGSYVYEFVTDDRIKNQISACNSLTHEITQQATKVLEANENRKYCLFENNGTSIIKLYFGKDDLGGAGIQVSPNGVYQFSTNEFFYNSDVWAANIDSLNIGSLTVMECN